MSYREQRPVVDWFDAGWAAFHFPVHPDFFPPLDDRTAQRAWLAGFGAAWAECPESVQREHVSWGVGLCGRTIAAALEAALAGRTELLRQFQMLGLPLTLAWR